MTSGSSVTGRIVLPPSCSALSSVGLRIVGADVERDVTVPVRRLADAAADAAVLLLDHRVRHVAADLLRLPTEELCRRSFCSLSRSLPGDLEVHDRMCHYRFLLSYIDGACVTQVLARVAAGGGDLKRGR